LPTSLKIVRHLKRTSRLTFSGVLWHWSTTFQTCESHYVQPRMGHVTTKCQKCTPPIYEL